MDPTHLHPWGARPILDGEIHHQHDKDLTYQPIFTTRITNLLEDRRQIYKRLLLDHLYRLRQLVVTAAGTGEKSAQSDVPPSDAPEESLEEGNLHTCPAEITFSEGSPLHNSPGRHSAKRHNSNSSPSVVNGVCSSENCIPRIPNAPQESSLVGEEMPEMPEGPFYMELAENPASSTFDKVSALISSPLDISVKGFSTPNDVMSTYRYINEMRQAYSSTVPPFFVTNPVAIFSPAARAQYQLDPNTSPDRQLNFHSNQQHVLSQALPVVPHSQNPTHLSSAHFYQRRNIPPLFARLFFEQELVLLFGSQLRYTYSAEGGSLTKATDLYIQELLPACHAPSVSHTALKSAQLELTEESSVTTPGNHRDGSAKTSSTSPSSALVFPNEAHKPHDANTFQRRTMYHSMTRTEELRAPTAAWCDDRVGADVGKLPLSTPPVPSHYAYAVASDVRGLPSYMNLQGVHSGNGNASVTLAFGFQRRTNYPFRRTYDQLRVAEKFSVPPKVPPRVSQDFASRVPVNGLSNTLLHLCPPDIHRGLFFKERQDESALEVEDTPRKNLYSINAEGKLFEEHAK